MSKLLAIPEAARQHGVKPDSMYHWARTGVLPVVRAGRRVFVDEDTFERWIAHGGQALPDKDPTDTKR